MRRSKWFWLSVPLGFYALSICVAQEAGKIQGVVTDAAGNPVSGANVYAVRKGEHNGHRVSRNSESASDGRFLLVNLDWGDYIVVAKREESGYPDTRLAFYSNLQVISTTINANHPDAEVAVTLPAPAGWLELTVTDANTGQALTSGSLTLRRVNNPSLYVTMSTSQSRIAIPAQTDVQVEINATGYSPWPGDRNPLVINLQSGEKRHVDVKLAPSP